MVTEAHPVDCYLPFGFRPPSEAHSPETPLPCSHRPQLALRIAYRLLFFFAGLIFSALYHAFSLLSIDFSKKFFGGQIKVLTAPPEGEKKIAQRGNLVI